jgi:hypothetical protein
MLINRGYTTMTKQTEKIFPTVEALILLGREHIGLVNQVRSSEQSMAEAVRDCYKGGTAGRAVMLETMNTLQSAIDTFMKGHTLPEGKHWDAATQRELITEYRIKEVLRVTLKRVAESVTTLKPMVIKTTIKNKGKKNESKTLKWMPVTTKVSAHKRTSKAVIDSTAGVSQVDLIDKFIELHDSLTDRDIVLNLRAGFSRAGKEKDILVFTHDDLVEYIQDEVKREVKKSRTTTPKGNRKAA